MHLPIRHHGSRQLVRLCLCFLHGCRNLGFGRFICRFRAGLSLCSFFPFRRFLRRVSQFRGFRGQFRIYRTHPVINGVKVFLMPVIILLNLFLGRGFLLRKMLHISVGQQTLFNVRLQSRLRGVCPEKVLHILLHSGAGFCGSILHVLHIYPVIFRGIIGKARRFRFPHQSLALLETFHGLFLKIIFPGKCFGIHLGRQVTVHIQSKVAQVRSVLVNIAVDRKMIIIVKLHPGHRLPVYFDVGSV